MAGQRIDIMNLKQLVRLKKEGYSNRRTAELLHVSRNTVNEYVRIFSAHKFSFEELTQLSNKELEDLFPCFSEVESYRYQTLTGLFSYFERELKKPGCTQHTLWQEYIKTYPDGYMYSQFCYHLSQWKERVDSSVKLDHKFGEKVFIDFTGKKLSYVDKSTGQIVEVNVFVAILPATSYTYVVATQTQCQQEVIEALRKCFQYMGGVPKVIVSDNLKAAVTKSHKYEPTINRSLNDFAFHYGCVVDPTRPYSPKDKAMVEGAVKIVYQRIFYPLSKH
jgi:predicted transcriptional regulator